MSDELDEKALYQVDLHTLGRAEAQRRRDERAAKNEATHVPDAEDTAPTADSTDA